MSWVKHKKGYEDYCRPPKLDRKWKEGQVWVCDCGNLLKVEVTTLWSSGGTFDSKSWVLINKELIN